MTCRFLQLCVHDCLPTPLSSSFVWACPFRPSPSIRQPLCWTLHLVRPHAQPIACPPYLSLSLPAHFHPLSLPACHQHTPMNLFLFLFLSQSPSQAIKNDEMYPGLTAPSSWLPLIRFSITVRSVPACNPLSDTGQEGKEKEKNKKKVLKITRACNALILYVHPKDVSRSVFPP